ncbi:hypothetical protein CLV71_103609 [Actinophytocola oryzae]|uniref:Uncharacterized protein n=1 Tax=Actinophytocola oryzae TaxID=502181 RepID=A0A4R7W098_9PSEU|nr:hypothetical protein CLV71_103609 [Actinophytocola oryzae]
MVSSVAVLITTALGRVPAWCRPTSRMARPRRAARASA